MTEHIIEINNYDPYFILGVSINEHIKKQVQQIKNL